MWTAGARRCADAADMAGRLGPPATMPPADRPEGKGVLRLVLGDQVSQGLSSLRDLDPARDTVLMAEVLGECTYVRHHPKKIVLVLAAMRHFALVLRAQGVTVRYIKLDDPQNRQSLRGEVERAVAELGPERIVVTEPGEWRVLEELRALEGATGVPVDIREDDRFLCSIDAFRAWAEGRRGLRMEFFYRDMRRRTGLLMEGDDPVGGAWNYDHANRRSLPAGIRAPAPPTFLPDAVTAEVIDLVRQRFASHFGSVEGFDLPVTAAEARMALADFIEHRLALFGDYQDAMAEGEATLFHSLLSPALNIGLLDPRTVCEAAEAAYREGAAPLNAVEGFIRQILGWREYVRGIYWLKMPGYAETNALDATRKLPSFYWTGETDMACLRAAIDQTRELAYAHHIQRLMVTGNFALLAGVDPREVNEWYLVVYADAFEWVQLPNTHGMAIHADGGIMASKPYAASGKYIDRMSDHCGGCAYRVKDSTGPRACPFNYLYWDFMARHRQRFAKNPRMVQMIRLLERMDPGKVAAMRAEAARFLDRLDRETREWRDRAA